MIYPATASMGRTVRGRALVATDGFSARYDLDRITGVFSRPQHALFGRSYVGLVLILDRAKGGVATAWMLREMAARGVVPAALVFNTVNPIMVQGAAFADTTMMSGFDVDITQAVPDGGLVEVDAEAAAPVLRVLDRADFDVAERSATG
jgi:predicted aconitase with swiveling domain